MKYEIDKGKLEAGMHEHAKNAINAYQRVVDSTKKQLPLIFESKDKHTRRSNYDLFKGAFDRLTEINKSNLEFAREYLGNLDIQKYEEEFNEIRDEVNRKFSSIEKKLEEFKK
jgi:hypothetical protein